MSEAFVIELLPPGLVAALLESADEGIAVVDGGDPDHPAVWLNPAFEQLTGFARAELVGNNLRVLQGADRDQPGLVEITAAMNAERACEAMLRNYRPDGTLYWNRLRMTPWRDAEGHLWWLVFARDVSAQREMELMLGRQTDQLDQAQHRLEETDPTDRLTGLQNEQSFMQSLELAWFSCARDRRSLTLFLFSADYFDVYLETFGRVAGDSAVRMVARAVGGAFRRASDVSARLGDAEFAALGIDMDGQLIEAHARRVCERVRALALRNPRAPHARDLSLGAAVLRAQPDRSPDWRGLLEQGRVALAEAQAIGTEQVEVRDYGRDG